MFQFQNGAIKRYDKFNFNNAEGLFQFQNGAIKSSEEAEEATLDTISIPKWCD